MESVLWMLQQASIPILAGLVMAFTLSRWGWWTRQAKVRAAVIYAGMITVGAFAEPFQLHAWLYNIGIQLRSGVMAAFGIGISMSLLRLSRTWKGRVTAGLFLTLYVAALWLRFETELMEVIRRFQRI